MIDLFKAVETPLTDEIDVTNTQQVLSRLMQYSKKHKEMPKQQALNIFKMGCLLNQGNTQLSIRELGDLTGIPYIFLSFSKTIARRYNNETTQFSEEYENCQATSWRDFMNKHSDKKKHDIPRYGRDFREKMAAMIAEARDNRQNETNWKLLKQTRDQILKVIPLDNTILDLNYLQYNECCCCGSYPPPPEGFEMRQYKSIGFLRYPACPDCVATNKPPSLEKIATLYATYAINIEKAFELIR